ncbi:MAG: GTPase HflX [Clostridiales bacterium]|nr:GTPase HflX [Clostridiales bacterium]
MKAILVAVITNQDNSVDLEELELLANTADYEVLGTLTQARGLPDKTYYLGSGKVHELKQLLEATEAEIVIFDNEPNGSHFNNLEDILQVDVIDRATLILQIFAKHATSNEGKLQVELALKKQNMPRAMNKAIQLSRQGGGGGGGGGARRGGGEQMLELDRRTIREEIRALQQKLKKMGEERELRRQKRKNSRVKSVCIVGYTNAGKSALMNNLVKANVLEENKLFATLDPVSRKLWLAPNKVLILTDTVGFISRLPHSFIEAFKSTLEETKYADLILHVVNLESKDILKEYDVVIDVLQSIGAGDIPIITLLNKHDIADSDVIPTGENVIYTSAKTGEGMDCLKDKICQILFGESINWQ